jgi:hypothetical protein
VADAHPVGFICCVGLSADDARWVAIGLISFNRFLILILLIWYAMVILGAESGLVVFSNLQVAILPVLAYAYSSARPRHRPYRYLWVLSGLGWV